jgi:multicomponent Na+:H+ antiporter subunit D
VAEEAVGGPLTVLYVLASAVTAAAVLRVAARVFLGLGPVPEEAGGEGDRDAYETTGSGEEPETEGRLGRVPDTMTAVPALLLAGAFAAGAVPGFGDAVAHALGEATTAGLRHTSVRWTPLGVGLGVLSSVLAVALAAVAVARPGLLAAPNPALPLRRLQSGHIGDYVAWLLVGATALGVLALPAVLSG